MSCRLLVFLRLRVASKYWCQRRILRVESRVWSTVHTSDSKLWKKVPACCVGVVWARVLLLTTLFLSLSDGALGGSTYAFCFPLASESWDNGAGRCVVFRTVFVMPCIARVSDCFGLGDGFFGLCFTSCYSFPRGHNAMKSIGRSVSGVPGQHFLKWTA